MADSTNEQLIPDLDRIEEMVTAHKWVTLRDSVEGAAELENAVFLQKNAESFFSLLKLHKHGKIFRLSLYPSIYRDGVGEPLASIAMTKEDLQTLRDYLDAALQSA